MTTLSTQEILTTARAAVLAAPPIGDPAYVRYCAELGRRLTAAWPTVTAANALDVADAQRRGLPPTLVDRLRMTGRHLRAALALAETVSAELPSIGADSAVPAARAGTLRRLPKPLGVVLMIYEARPTVTIDGALLPVVVGNAALLRGGKECAATDAALAGVIRAALDAAGLPPGLVTVLADPDRSLMKSLLARPDQVDVLIPRGSPSLLEYCRTASTIPTITSGGGVNHLYVHTSADLPRAARVTLDSKLPEPAGCTSVELVLVDRAVAAAYLDELAAAVRAARAALTVRVDPSIAAAAPPPPDGDGWRREPLEPHDLGREFLDPAIGVLAVDGLDGAVAHIRRYGSGHTEGVVATDPAVRDGFARRVDAATVVVNGSLRLHDGPTLGLGPELSIATGRLHVRGPVTLASLVTRTLLVESDGALRG